MSGQLDVGWGKEVSKRSCDVKDSKQTFYRQIRFKVVK
jgi:hypothetical protein